MASEGSMPVTQRKFLQGAAGIVVTYPLAHLVDGMAPALAVEDAITRKEKDAMKENQMTGLTPAIAVSLHKVVEVRMSPDGLEVLFQAERPRRSDEGPGAPVSEIWKIAADGGQPTRISDGTSSAILPRYSLDGKFLSWLRIPGSGGKPLLCIAERQGGDIRTLVAPGTAVMEYEWMPDSASLAVLAVVEKSAERMAAEREGRDWFIDEKPFQHKRLFVIHVETGATIVVTGAEHTVNGFGVSPDGHGFALAIAPSPGDDDRLLETRLCLVSAQGGELVPFKSAPKRIEQPRFSPDGRYLAFRGPISLEDPWRGEIFVAPAASGDLHDITAGYTGSVRWFGWRPGHPATVIFSAFEGQATAAYEVQVETQVRRPFMTVPIVYASGPSFSADGRAYSLVAESPRHPPEVFVAKSGSVVPARITGLNPSIETIELATQEIVQWNAHDGVKMEGLLVKPLGYREGSRYPTVVQIHGGPESADTNGWFGSFGKMGQLLAARGYAAFYPNYRGSLGRGVEFARASRGDIGGKELDDILSGLDRLIDRGLADPDRCGLIGGSHGGFLSALGATKYSKRFKAAVVVNGITDWVSYAGADGGLEEQVSHFGFPLYENPSRYLASSPIAYIADASTPILILHGEADKSVPVAQARELYSGLKSRGVPTQLVVYPREGHAPAREKAHLLDCLERSLGWFDRYVMAKKDFKEGGR